MLERIRAAELRWWHPGELFIILFLIVPVEACRWCGKKWSGHCYPYCDVRPREGTCEVARHKLVGHRWGLLLRCRKCGHEFDV